MPRSFLVKKYFSNKKPCYRESLLDSQTGMLNLCKLFFPVNVPLKSLSNHNLYFKLEKLKMVIADSLGNNISAAKMFDLDL